MKIETKGLTVEKMDGEGRGLARIATLSAIDHDGDTYLPGAFSWKEGGIQWVPILPAHDRRAMPLGKARVYEENNAALAEIHLNLGSDAGREWHSTLKFDLENGQAVQEWSYGFGVIDAQYESRDGERVRVLKRLDVHEVSPVVRGAGIDTATLGLKSRGSFAVQIESVLAEIDDIVGRAGGLKALREADGRGLSKARIDQLANLKGKLEELIASGAPETDPAEQLAVKHLTASARRRLGL
ncbi:HK97 family phage prohead protease [Stappia sp. F7233]|uniref:HK97 family phage prohead protease n=1 Tax=Stappia albiluteola TaxID=2758565 RepID=A0A839AEA5_9HYPH|nr:HK97 family phage prohead protease [Stappia albiluteola]MBA5777466.1 HK97 family phage prohead protease [Stappia albiluteola]MBA5777504.1 HK97 family phage prohead protease [Stappia albiluteola]MBA5778085.1 HK97 family phage prohead protease [Stappia albiluteola]MBA5778138.1 HK97 family phage prohead protease [Stappia albiluteola]